MNVTATYNGAPVTIVAIVPVGSLIFVSFIDGSGNLKIAKNFFANNVEDLTIATGASVA